MSSDSPKVDSPTSSSVIIVEKPTSSKPENKSLFPENIVVPEPQRKPYHFTLTAFTFSLLALCSSIYLGNLIMSPPQTSAGLTVSAVNNNPATDSENKGLNISLKDQKISNGDTALQRDKGRWTLSFRKTSISFGKKREDKTAPANGNSTESKASTAEKDNSNISLHFASDELSPADQQKMDQHDSAKKYSFLTLIGFIFLGSIFTAISNVKEHHTSFTVMNIIMISFAILSLYLLLVMNVLLIMISIIPFIILLLIVLSIVNGSGGGFDFSFG